MSATRIDKELLENINKYFWPAPFSGTGHPLQVAISGGVENHVFVIPYSTFQTGIEALVHEQQHQLLDELMEQKKTYITELAWKHAASEEAVPVSAIEALKEGLK